MTCITFGRAGWFALVSGIILCIGTKADDFKDELPRIEALSPEQAQKKIAIVDGFRVELVASEPMITSPVAVEWDAEGSLFVCEMRGYSEDRELNISRIVKLIDSDGDGKFERRTVFADGLKWPTALFPYKGGLFVGDAPHLYYFQDEDGDGTADSRKIAITGFGVSNVQGLMNSMRWGLDNRIHVACSSVGGLLTVPEQGNAPVQVRRSDISFDPERFDIRVESGGAQHGMSFDDWGHKFMSSNSDHLQQVTLSRRYLSNNPRFANVRTRMSIAKDGPQAPVYRISPVEPWRIVRTRLRVSGLASGPIEGGGTAAGYFTGATGAFIYRGDASPSLRGLAIVGDVGSNLVHRKQLEYVGPRFIGKRIDEQTEFLASKDIWFRPAQFACGPDGCLTIIDVCREVIEHPKSLPPSIKQHIDLTAGRDRGRLWRVVEGDPPKSRQANLDTLSSIDLVDYLAHRNAWHRETAARLVYERQDEASVKPLKKLLRASPNILARLHALYCLEGLGALAVADIDRALQDPHPQVRRHALILAESIGGDAVIYERCLAMANDQSLPVRVQLALSLPSIADEDRVEILLQLAERDSKYELARQAIVLASSSCEMQLAKGLLESVADAEFKAGQLALLAELVGQIRPRTTEGTQELVNLLMKRGAGDPLQLLQLIQATGNLQVTGLPDLDDDAARWINKLELGAIRIALDSSERAFRRAEALELLGPNAIERISPKELSSLLDVKTPSQVQRALFELLDRVNASNLVEITVREWPNMLPEVRRVASEACFRTQSRIEMLVDRAETGEIRARDIDRSRWQTALQIVDDPLVQRIESLGVAMPTKDRELLLAEYSASLKKGDADRGKKLFKQHCAACHRLEQEGFEVGPSLAAIKTRGPQAILTNILNPNAEVNPEYVNYIVLVDNGQTASGMIESENENSLSLLKDGGKQQTISRESIEEIRNSGMSLMPEGFEENISPTQMSDLIQYLMTVTVQ